MATVVDAPPLPSPDAVENSTEPPCTLAYPRVVLEPHRVRWCRPTAGRARSRCWPGTATSKRARWAAHSHVLVLLEVVVVGLEDGEDRLGGRVGRKALPQHLRMSRVSRPGVSNADVGRNLTRRIHLRDARRKQQAFVSKLGSPSAPCACNHPVLLAGGVHVMTAGLPALASTTSGPYLMNGPTMLLTTLAPREQLRSARRQLCSTSDHFVALRSSMPGTRSIHFLDFTLGRVATRGDERGS